MGAGKTTVGRLLAERLGLPFVDADEEIARPAGLSVAEIFDRFGEAHFRDAERQVVARLMAGPPRVIATGGGAFVDESTRRLILERGVAVWLDAKVETLVERTRRSGHRPLLRGGDAGALLAGLARRRNPIYAEAPIAIRCGTLAPDGIADLIIEALATAQA